MGRDRRLAANARAAAKERSADQRAAHAQGGDVTCPATGKETEELRCFVASVRQSPVRARRADSVGSGGAQGRSAPLLGGCCLCVSLVATWLARRIQRRDQGSVNCEMDAPPRPHAGRPLAMTSMRPSSGRATWTLRSRSSTEVATVAPASRQTRAAARSRDAPPARKWPDRGHAARWSP